MTGHDSTSRPPGSPNSPDASPPTSSEHDDSPGDPISVVVVDEQGLFREGLAGLLSAAPDINVLAKASDDEAPTVIRERQPDVVLLGSDMSNAMAAEHMRAVAETAPLTKMVVLATRDDPRRVKHLLSLGAHAYMLKSATIDELLTTIRVVERNHDRVVLSVSRHTLERLRASGDPLLSTREMEVLALVAEGMRNSQIAAKLFIAEGTVKRHLTNIYAKLGATSRTDAIRRAARRGLGSEGFGVP